MIRKFIALAMAMHVTHAVADTYVVVSNNGNDEIKTAVKHGKQTCFYAGKEIQPGDTVVLKDAGIEMVCAKSERDSIFYVVSQDRTHD